MILCNKIVKTNNKYKKTRFNVRKYKIHLRTVIKHTNQERVSLCIFNKHPIQQLLKYTSLYIAKNNPGIIKVHSFLQALSLELCKEHVNP